MALFNVRIYGVLFDEQKRLLVSDEFIRETSTPNYPAVVWKSEKAPGIV